MITKQNFGAFVREKRLEKALTQRELAELLFVSESAVSKWEMGKSYPDITMIPGLCKTLGVSEQELLAGATDTEFRRIQHEAKLYRRISETWFWGLTIAYATAMAICLVCDLAINHALTFSVVVFAALLLAYSFAPSWIRFSRKHKLETFVGTSYLSLLFLFLVCCAKYHQGWFGIAAVAVLLGYAVCVGPFLIRKWMPERFGKLSLLAYFIAIYLCLFLLLVVIRISVAYSLWNSVLISFYAFIPFLAIGLVHLLGIDWRFKAAIDVLVVGLVGYSLPWLVDRMVAGGPSLHYRIDFSNWSQCASANIASLVLLVFFIAAVALVIAGLVHVRSSK